MKRHMFLLIFTVVAGALAFAYFATAYLFGPSILIENVTSNQMVAERSEGSEDHLFCLYDYETVFITVTSRIGPRYDLWMAVNYAYPKAAYLIISGQDNPEKRLETGDILFVDFYGLFRYIGLDKVSGKACFELLEGPFW